MYQNPTFIKNIQISEYDYNLPEERIAKYPLTERDQSKILIYKNGKVEVSVFNKLPELLSPDHLLVFNNTRVIPARLKFNKATGASIEIFCLEPVEPAEYERAFQSRRCVWKCIVGNLKKWKSDILIKAVDGKMLQARKIKDFKTHQYIEFTWDDSNLSFSEIIELIGVTPIPPYLNRESEEVDRDRYQTVYSSIKGSVAAPTAGLHFTDSLLQSLNTRGITQAHLTLHVGAGTFKPVQSNSVHEHEMHTEFFAIALETVKLLINKHKSIVAVGTTSLRTLESLYWLGIKIKNDLLDKSSLHLNQWEPYELRGTLTYPEALEVICEYMRKKELTTLYATTRIMIVPGYQIRSSQALITNFHQPKSTLLLLIAAAIGSDWRRVYDYALNNDFRFLSYGDSSLLFMNHQG
jgi:S-adenosylmethionine:tRNA ribosyltransferase-isomerase